MDTAERPVASKAESVYDGFVSYSHAADGLLAPRLQSALQQFAKPWWKRRAVRIFRDESSLSANPHLWSSITEALDSSEWFVLLLSRDAAQSPWVNQEIEYWREHNDPSRILPVLTDGTFVWDGTDVAGSAVPDQLRGVFSEEPRWVDLRFAQDEEQLDLKNPRFSAAVADIASALRGLPKDELESEEVRQHRRNIRTAWGAASLVGLLAIAAIIFAIQASTERDRAAEEARRAEANAQLAKARELAASAIGVVDTDPELATLLALQAIDASPAGAEQPIEVINALWQAGSATRLLDVLDVGNERSVLIDLSQDGGRLLVSSKGSNSLTLWDTSSLDGPLWEFSEQTVDSFNFPTLSPDGRFAAVSVLDSESHEGQFDAEVEVEPDVLANRTHILDADSGQLVTTLVFPECVGVDVTAFAQDGSLLAVGSGWEGCPREGAESGQWVEVYETATWEPVLLHELTGDAFGVRPVFTSDGRLYLFNQDRLQVLDQEFADARLFDQISGFGDVTDDGSLVAAFVWPARNDVVLFDGVTGQQLDLLTPWDGFPRRPSGVSFSPDGEYVNVATEAEATHVFRVPTGNRDFSVAGGSADIALTDVSGGRLFTAHPDGIVRVWDLGASTFGIEPAGDLGTATWVNSNSFVIGDTLGLLSPIDFTRFAEDQSVEQRFFDLSDGSLTEHRLVARGNMSAALGDQRFLYAPEPGYLFVIDLNTDEERYLIGCPGDEVTQTCADSGEPWPNHLAVLSQDGSELAAIESREGEDESQEAEESWTIFDPDTLEVIAKETHIGTGGVLAFSHDWIVRDDHGAVQTYATARATGEDLWRVDVSGRTEVSPTGGSIAVIEDLGGLTLIDLQTGQAQVYPDISGAWAVRGMGFSVDESAIALGNDQELLIFDFESEQVTQRIPIPGVSDIYWLDDKTLVIGSKHGVWGRISLDVEDLVASAQRNLLRGFTDDECQTYRIDPCPSLKEIRGR